MEKMQAKTSRFCDVFTFRICREDVLSTQWRQKGGALFCLLSEVRDVLNRSIQDVEQGSTFFMLPHIGGKPDGYLIFIKQKMWKIQELAILYKNVSVHAMVIDAGPS